MKGNEQVVAELNAALRAELTAIVQYIVHAEMRENWGYKRLSQDIRKQAIEEMQHAEKIIERLLFLDATPAVEFGLEPKVGGTLRQQLQNDMDAELGAVKQYNNASAVCEKAGDNGSRELFKTLLVDEEGHVDFHEAQFHQIEEMGYENYLSMQTGEKGE